MPQALTGKPAQSLQTACA